jgi:hypothetical protein
MKDDSFGVTTLSMIDDEKQSMYVYVIGIRRFLVGGKRELLCSSGYKFILFDSSLTSLCLHAL